MPNYNMNDPQDVTRFQLNMLCHDLVMTIQDGIQRIQPGTTEYKVSEAFKAVAVAIKALDDLTCPKAMRG